MKLKRYLLFCGGTYYPYGGWDDFAGSYDSLEQAEKAAYDDWWHIVDSDTGEIIKRDRRHVY